MVWRPSAQNDSAAVLGGRVLEKGYRRDARTDFDAKYVKSAVPRNEVPFGGRETKI